MPEVRLTRLERSTRQDRTFPDGKAGFVEVKSPGKKPRKIQLLRHQQLRRLGFQVFVLDKKEDIGGVLDGIQGT